MKDPEGWNYTKQLKILLDLMDWGALPWSFALMEKAVHCRILAAL